MTIDAAMTPGPMEQWVDRGSNQYGRFIRSTTALLDKAREQDALVAELAAALRAYVANDEAKHYADKLHTDARAALAKVGP